MTSGGNNGRNPAVLVDATSLNRRMKGVGRYAWHLCEALSRNLPSDVDLVLAVFEGDLPDFPADFRGRWRRLPYRSEVRLGLVEFPKLIRETGARVFIRPADKIGRRYQVPTLTVCHDLNSLIWAAQPSRSWRRRILDQIWDNLRGRALRHSDRVVCNSEFVRAAATRHFGLSPEKTSVGYCGVDRRIPELAKTVSLEEIRKKMGGAGFLLAFATGDEREGFGILPELWAAARSAGYPGRLVVAGVKADAEYARDLRRKFRERGQTESVVEVPFLGEDKIGELAGLYAAADFYLETSRHEGFGMQLVEAMSCGTTCFSSNRGALAEVGGSFPLALDIDSPALAGRALAAAWQSGMQARRNEAQVAHALSFDWNDTCAQVTQFARAHGR